ncbi:MAG: alkane 1-monooxygenase [Gammaproteobacteria bacterium]|nr:alkane 1-monooxygenase [Gammaproteobacteria bacterium]
MGVYLRYFGTHLLLLVTAVGFLLGGAAHWLGLASGVVVWIGADALSPRVGAAPAYRHRALLDVALYSLFPPLAALTAIFAWSLSRTDVLGFGAWLHSAFGYDALAARAATAGWDLVGGAWSFALAIALGGILVAHELVHRTRDPLALAVGRWMLAIAFNATLEVAHVFGHHRDVGTPADPTTARRGESVYHFYLRSTFGQVAQAWQIERERLAGASAWQRWWSNRVLRGFLRSWSVAGVFFAVGGWRALGVFLLAAAYNKLLLEALNYMEHYGLVRVPGTPIEPRHSWNSVSAFSHAVLFNLPWHADHHARSQVQYPELHATETAPVLGQGYLATLPLVLVPPLWRRLIAPRLAAWDRERASAAERCLVGGDGGG